MKKKFTFKQIQDICEDAQKSGTFIQCWESSNVEKNSFEPLVCKEKHCPVWKKGE